MREYDVGDLVEVFTQFTDPRNNNAPVDPTSVFLRVEDPSGNVTEYEYDGVDLDDTEDGRIWRVDEGDYHFNINLDEAGVWSYYWFSTGTGQAAEKKSIRALGGIDDPTP